MANCGMGLMEITGVVTLICGGHPCGEERGRRGMGMAYDNKVHVGSGDY